MGDLTWCCFLNWSRQLLFVLLSMNNDDSHGWQILSITCQLQSNTSSHNLKKKKKPREDLFKEISCSCRLVCVKKKCPPGCAAFICLCTLCFVRGCPTVCVTFFCLHEPLSRKRRSHASWGQVRTPWGALFSRRGGPRGRGTPSALLGNSLGLIEAWLVSHVSTYWRRRRIPLPRLRELL